MSGFSLSASGAAKLSRHGRFPAVDYSLPSFQGENRETMLILGSALGITLLLAGVAFGSVSLIFQLIATLT